jgi:hypothetical protein
MGGFFGRNTAGAPAGAQLEQLGTGHVKFKPRFTYKAKMQMVVSGEMENMIWIRCNHQCITHMKHYENKSLEELRWEDYEAAQRGPGWGVVARDVATPDQAMALPCPPQLYRKSGSKAAAAVVAQGGVGEFQVIRVLQSESKVFDDTDPLSVGFRVAVGQVMLMQNKKIHTGLAIHSVDIVMNTKLQKKFNSKKNELTRAGFRESRLLFHGTLQENIEDILRNNFNLSFISNGRVHGDGVYFTEQPETSLRYAGGQDGPLKASLILCEVLRGHNSRDVMREGDGRCWTVVVPDVDQIMPRYVVNFH